MLPVEVLVPGANSRSTFKHCSIYTGPSLLELYKSHNNIYIYKAAYNNILNHVIIFLVPSCRAVIFFHLFGNGTHTGSIGKKSVVFPPIGKK